MRAWRAALLPPIVGCVLIGSRVEAQPASNQKLAAQALFDEAKALAAANRWEEVCPRLEQSEELDPSIVTVYRLADCYEHVGRTASAWALFVEAASKARAAREDARAKVAEARAASLERRVSRLVVIVPPTPGIQVSRGDAPVAQALWGTKIPVDPGPQTIRATAPGKKPFVTTVQVPADAAVLSVTVPPLENEEPLQYWPADAYPGAERSEKGIAPPLSEPVAPRGHSSLETAGGVTFFLGIGTMGTAGVLMATNGAPDPCPFTKCGLPLVMLFSGAVVTTVGGVLWLAGHMQPSTTVSFGPGSLTLRRTF